MANKISKYDDVIDSRDVIERLGELAAMWLDHINDPTTPELDEDEKHELEVLTALSNEAQGYAADWFYGETLIRDSYFVTYAEELAKECGMVDESAKWPMSCIDWEQAAWELQYDYTSVDFDGITYWVR